MKTIFTIITFAILIDAQAPQRIDLNAAMVQFRAKTDGVVQEFQTAIQIVAQLSAENQRLKAENDSLRNVLKPKPKEKK